MDSYNFKVETNNDQSFHCLDVHIIVETINLKFKKITKTWKKNQKFE